jgi:hypothetical protein
VPVDRQRAGCDSGDVPDKPPTCAPLADEIEARHDSLCADVIPLLEGLPGQGDGERRQFISGFLHLVSQAARGDLSLRDEYLETIIPGCKHVGMDLGYIVSVLVHIFMELGARVGEDAKAFGGDAARATKRAFLTTFAIDYTKRLVAVWQRS